MRYITILLTDKPTFLNNKQIISTTFEGVFVSQGDKTAFYGKIDGNMIYHSMENLHQYLDSQDQERLLSELLKCQFVRQKAVDILRNKYGCALSQQTQEDQILDFLMKMAEGGVR